MTTKSIEQEGEVLLQMRADKPEGISRIAQELERQQKTKQDYISPAKSLSAVNLKVSEDSDSVFKIGIGMSAGVPPALYNVSQIAHDQIADKMDVPRNYYRRMLGNHNDLLTTNLNYWFERAGKTHLIRILDGRIRAFLSDRYRSLDNSELFFSGFQVAKEVGAEIKEVILTERRFYMQLLHPDWVEIVNNPFGGRGGSTDDRIVPGAILSNSEIGEGGMKVEPFLFRLICRNGMIGMHTIKQIHLGRQLEEGWLSYETKEMEDRTIWSKVRDLMYATFDREHFKEMVEQMSGAAEKELANPIQAVDNVVKHYGLTDDDKQAILTELISPSTSIDPGRTVYGLLNAVTSRANHYEDYNRTAELQRIGGELLQEKVQKELVSVRVR